MITMPSTRLACASDGYTNGTSWTFVGGLTWPPTRTGEDVTAVDEAGGGGNADSPNTSPGTDPPLFSTAPGICSPSRAIGSAPMLDGASRGIASDATFVLPCALVAVRGVATGGGGIAAGTAVMNDSSVGGTGNVSVASSGMTIKATTMALCATMDNGTV